MLRIISWNVNGIRAISQKGFQSWIDAEQPDLLCVQETKAHPDQLTADLLAPKGYQSVFHSAQKKGYSGVATYFKKEPLSVTDMGIEAYDSEGRVQALEYKNFTLINAYFPNSQEERARIAYKVAFCDDMLAYCNRLAKAGKNIVLCGDYNIAHKPIDLARPKENENSAGYYIEERQSMEKFLGAGYIDTFRHFTPDPGHYTWWSYRGGARERNVGWRIDYHCVNKDFIKQVKAAHIMPHVMGSDHCPVVVDIKSP